MGKNTVVLIHGYADKGQSFQAWKQKLQVRGYDDVKVMGYASLSSEVTIKDIAEGFERALHLPGGLEPGQEFDAIVHSTGMLVVRSWLTAYPERRNRLKHLIGLAPASFGSPIAHRAKGLLGVLLKGNREKGSDFMEVGTQILDALELGSRYTWDLAHQDLLSDSKTFYGANSDTPYVFIFCGTSAYQGFKKFIRQAGPGVDGTVRLAGCALNSRKLVVDLTKKPQTPNRINFGDWKNIGITPLIPVQGLNHATILRDPSDEIVEMVDAALRVASEEDIQNWYKTTSDRIKSEFDKIDHWQQFVVRAVDDNGDPIVDYNLQLATHKDGKLQPIEEFKLQEHIYSGDKSLRCFHVNLKPIQEKQLKNLWLQITASSGTPLLSYNGYVDSEGATNSQSLSADGKWSGDIDISQLLHDEKKKLFYPFTTTLIELRLNRQPTQEGIEANNRVCWFLST